MTNPNHTRQAHSWKNIRQYLAKIPTEKTIFMCSARKKKGRAGAMTQR
jgi:hypothetical protein